MPKIVLDVDPVRFAHYQQEAAKNYRTVPKHVMYLLEHNQPLLSQTVPIPPQPVTTSPQPSQPVTTSSIPNGDYTLDDLSFDD